MLRRLALDAEVEIAPEKEEGGDFDAGFKKLDGIWCCDHEAADDQSSGCSDHKRPAESPQLEWEPSERALQQGAANRAKGQAREEDAKANDELVAEEAFNIGIAEFPRLADVGHNNQKGDETKATAAYDLEQPEGSEMDLWAVKHGRHFTLGRHGDGGDSSQKGLD